MEILQSTTYDYQNLWQPEKLDLLKYCLWTDCVFLVGYEDGKQQEFKCHRILLARISPVFASMLYGALKEEGVIRITDVTPNAFKILLKYAYSDIVDMPRLLQQIVDFTYAAHKYLLTRLVSLCEQILVTSLLPIYACEMYEFAQLLNMSHLKTKSFQLIIDHTHEILTQHEITFLDAQYATILEIVKQEKLMIDTECELIIAVFAWAERQAEKKGLQNRTEDLRYVLGDIFSYLRFLTLNEAEFTQGLWTSNVLSNDEKSAILAHISCCFNALSPMPELPDGICEFSVARQYPILTIPDILFEKEFPEMDSGELREGLVAYLSFTPMIKILLTGIEISTQMEINPNIDTGNVYNEQIEIVLINSETGSTVERLAFYGWAEYNTHFNLTFINPVLLDANVRYSIMAIFHKTGIYLKSRGCTLVPECESDEHKIPTSSTELNFINTFVYKKLIANDL